MYKEIVSGQWPPLEMVPGAWVFAAWTSFALLDAWFFAASTKVVASLGHEILCRLDWWRYVAWTSVALLDAWVFAAWTKVVVEISVEIGVEISVGIGVEIDVEMFVAMCWD